MFIPGDASWPAPPPGLSADTVSAARPLRARERRKMRALGIPDSCPVRARERRNAATASTATARNVVIQQEERTQHFFIGEIDDDHLPIDMTQDDHVPGYSVEVGQIASGSEPLAFDDFRDDLRRSGAQNGQQWLARPVCAATLCRSAAVVPVCDATSDVERLQWATRRRRVRSSAVGNSCPVQ